MQFFCIKMPKFAEELRKACPDIGEEYFGKWEEIPENEVVAVPSPSEINEHLSGGTDEWRLIVSLDVDEIKSLYAKLGGKINVPRRVSMPFAYAPAISVSSRFQREQHIFMAKSNFCYNSCKFHCVLLAPLNRLLLSATCLDPSLFRSFHSQHKTHIVTGLSVRVCPTFCPALSTHEPQKLDC
ncbi:unnamed protein product [Gongylonema pulchrum]|uniref:Propep_M14 domain-containing protein n=1 Tax=Gongylonema pulchrum TaxID=637853 RepID=A0A183D6T4_9BILA|nr:unnamed protein product [Gongylonema pulchrum]